MIGTETVSAHLVREADLARLPDEAVESGDPQVLSISTATSLAHQLVDLALLAAQHASVSGAKIETEIEIETATGTGTGTVIVIVIVTAIEIRIVTADMLVMRSRDARAAHEAEAAAAAAAGDGIGAETGIAPRREVAAGVRM